MPRLRVRLRPHQARRRAAVLDADADLRGRSGSRWSRGRTHGPHPSATEAIAWALAEARPLRLFTDQYRTPVDPESVADALTALLSGGPGGLYHLGGPERLSRFELGLRVAAVLGLDPRRHRAGPPGGPAFDAPRPADVSLDVAPRARPARLAAARRRRGHPVGPSPARLMYSRPPCPPRPSKTT
jgi:hypothetical protein